MFIIKFVSNFFSKHMFLSVRKVYFKTAYYDLGHWVFQTHMRVSGYIKTSVSLKQAEHRV